MPDVTEIRVGGSGCKFTVVDTEPVAPVTLAETVSCVGTVPCDGAEYKPLLLIVPTTADHWTTGVLTPATVAVNCWVCPYDTVGLAGAITIENTVAVAEPDLVGSLTLVAVTVMGSVLGGVVGAT